MLLRLQSAEVDAAPFQLDGRTCDDGLLRADALQQPPWHRGHRRHEDVLRVADAGALENLRDALRFFLVLHGDWRGGIRSEERRVGKEWRTGWGREQWTSKMCDDT